MAEGSVVMSGGAARATDVGNTTSTTARVVQATGSSINTGQASVGASATLIIAANPNRIRLTIYNTGTTVVYVGGNAVTTSTGSFLAGIAGYPIVIRSSAAVYGVVASGTQTVTYIEEVK